MLLNLPKTRRGDVWRFDARIHSEPEFRYPTIIRESDNLARRVVVSRWAGRSEVPREHRAEILDEYHTIGVSMVPTQLRLSVSERTFFALCVAQVINIKKIGKIAAQCRVTPSLTRAGSHPRKTLPLP